MADLPRCSGIFGNNDRQLGNSFPSSGIAVPLFSPQRRSSLDRELLAGRASFLHARNRVEREPLCGVLLRDAPVGRSGIAGRGRRAP